MVKEGYRVLAKKYHPDKQEATGVERVENEVRNMTPSPNFRTISRSPASGLTERPDLPDVHHDGSRREETGRGATGGGRCYRSLGRIRDAHAIEPPPGKQSGRHFHEVNQMADTVVNRQREQQQQRDDDLFAVDPADITSASVHYCEQLVARLEKLNPTAPYQLIADSTVRGYIDAGAMR